MNQTLMFASLAAVAVAAAAGSAAAETTTTAAPVPAATATTTASAGPDRGGFTAELSIGAGVGHNNFSENAAELDIALINVGLGAWINPKLAVTFRLTSEGTGDGEYVWLRNFVGPSAQYMVTDKLWLGGGVGLGAVDFFAGLGLQARVGYSVLTSRHHALNLGVQVTPVFEGDFTTVGATAQVGWQFL